MASILWFRHGLRLHDNPAMLEALKNHTTFLPIFIFDGESAGTKNVGYNRMKFLLESLRDLNDQLKIFGGRLYLLAGNPVEIFTKLHATLKIDKICVEQDCEPIWKPRDDSVKDFCGNNGIPWFEFVSHTLWDPKKVIETNRGTPPLTYQMFLYIVTVIGAPPRPVDDADWSCVRFAKVPDTTGILIYPASIGPQDLGIEMEGENEKMVRWQGGERRALVLLEERLKVEEGAFLDGFYLPNHARPNLLATPTSQSPALRFGCLSVRKFYWSVYDLYNKVIKGQVPANSRINGQLIWRDYFYTMSVNNPYYAEIERNPICIDIPWYKNEAHLKAWKDGKTGFPFIDAVMRQLKNEGWIHHVGRNAVAAFLTRGILWISWEDGLQHFLRYLLDADWSVCAGNWMWVSSSAFEQLLDCSACACPVSYGRRLDPWGEYVRRYVPELRNLPNEYLYEPWKAPLDVQCKANAVIGRDYPERIVDHVSASLQNRKKMGKIREQLMACDVPHCAPSNSAEVAEFMWLPENCMQNISM